MYLKKKLQMNLYVDVTDLSVRIKLMLQKKVAVHVVEKDVILRSWGPDVNPATSNTKM